MTDMPTIESRVQERLDADREVAMSRCEKLQQEFTAAEAALAKAQEKFDHAVEKVTEDQEKPVTEAQEKAVRERHREVGKASLTVLRAKGAYVEAKKAASKLMTDKEYDRRLKSAKKFGQRTEPLTGVEAARIVLSRHGRPMHYTEITREALESGVLRLEGKTPEATMSAYLAKATKKGDTFVRVDRGVFALKPKADASTDAAK